MLLVGVSEVVGLLGLCGEVDCEVQGLCVSKGAATVVGEADADGMILDGNVDGGAAALQAEVVYATLVRL